jgi:hypothetical protein
MSHYLSYLLHLNICQYNRFDQGNPLEPGYQQDSTLYLKRFLRNLSLICTKEGFKILPQTVGKTIAVRRIKLTKWLIFWCFSVCWLILLRVCLLYELFFKIWMILKRELGCFLNNFFYGALMAIINCKFRLGQIIIHSSPILNINFLLLRGLENMML